MKNNFIFDYFRGVWSELKKVSWPTRTEVINHTVVVIVSAALAILIISALDFSLAKAVELLVQTRS